MGKTVRSIKKAHMSLIIRLVIIVGVFLYGICAVILRIGSHLQGVDYYHCTGGLHVLGEVLGIIGAVALVLALPIFTVLCFIEGDITKSDM
jgi:hypothetical protein